MAHKKHEDYLRGLLCFGPAGATLAGKSLWHQKLDKAYKKDLGLRKAIARAMKRVTPITPAGLILPPKLGIKIDWDRVYKVVEKWVRGFYYLEYQEALSPEVTVEIVPVYEGNRTIWSPITPQLNPGKWGWNDVFLYHLNRLTEQHEVSCWLFHIYKSHELFAITRSPDEALF